MPAIVEQIQLDALNSDIPVSTLLGRVKFAAAKLDLGRVEDWVEHELNGYTGPVPDYRRVQGHPMVLNPHHGWEPIGGFVEQLSRKGIVNPWWRLPTSFRATVLES